MNITASSYGLLQTEKLKAMVDAGLSEASYLTDERDYHAAIKQAEAAVMVLRELHRRFPE